MTREEHSAVSRAVAGLLGVGLDCKHIHYDPDRPQHIDGRQPDQVVVDEPAEWNTVAQISAFDTAEGRRLYAKATAFDEVLGIAAEALTIAGSLLSDEIGLIDKTEAAQRVRALRERLALLEATCRLGFWWPAR